MPSSNVPKSPAFQFYPADWLSDESVAMLTAAQEGYYIRAICFCWREGSIPADPNKLMLLLGKMCTLDDATLVQRLFEIHPKDDTRLVHKRLQKEMQKQAEWRAKCSKAGKKSGESRSCRTKVSSTNLQRVVELNTNSLSLSLSSKSNKEAQPPGSGNLKKEPHKIKLRLAREEILKTISSGELNRALRGWCDWREKEHPKKKPVTPQALMQLLKRYANRAQDLLADIRWSVSQDWEGVFPERKFAHNGSRPDAHKNRPLGPLAQNLVSQAMPHPNRVLK